MKSMLTCMMMVALGMLFVMPQMAMAEDAKITNEMDAKFADDLHFDMIENEIRTIEMCMAKIIELSNKPHGNQKTTRNQEDHSSNKVARFVALKEAAADELHDIISDYWLTVRVRNWPNTKKNPEGYGSQEYKDFCKMLEYLQSALTYNMWNKQLTMNEKPRATRNYMKKFRELWEDPRCAGLRRGSYRDYVLDSVH
jgi:hypothetical protein